MVILRGEKIMSHECSNCGKWENTNIDLCDDCAPKVDCDLCNEKVSSNHVNILCEGCLEKKAIEIYKKLIQENMSKYLKSKLIISEEKSLSCVKRLADAITDDIVNTPDEEILKEVKEDYGNQEYEANIVRKIIWKVKRDMTKQEINCERITVLKNLVQLMPDKFRTTYTNWTIAAEIFGVPWEAAKELCLELNINPYGYDFEKLS